MRFKLIFAEKKYKAVPPEIILHRQTLREMLHELKKRSREYEKMKLLLSERNPRYVESKANYETFLNEFNEFKKNNNIPDFNESILSGLDGIVSEYQQTEVILEQLELSMKSLQVQITQIQEKEKKLQHMIPEHDQVEQLQATVGKNVSLLVEELTRVRSSIAHVPNDITINEQVVGTKEFSPFPVKIIALLVIAAIFVSAAYAVVRVFWDIAYGNFSGLDEAAFHKDFFDTVGIIPDANVQFTPAQRNILTNEMFYHFILRLKNIL